MFNTGALLIPEGEPVLLLWDWSWYFGVLKQRLVQLCSDRNLLGCLSLNSFGPFPEKTDRNTILWSYL